VVKQLISNAAWLVSVIVSMKPMCKMLL